jgi:hypothetical protein
MLCIEKSCVSLKNSHFTHVVIFDLGETCMIYQTYPVNELIGTRLNFQGLGQLFQSLSQLFQALGQLLPALILNL